MEKVDDFSFNGGICSEEKRWKGFNLGKFPIQLSDESAESVEMATTKAIGYGFLRSYHRSRVQRDNPPPELAVQHLTDLRRRSKEKHKLFSGKEELINCWDDARSKGILVVDDYSVSGKRGEDDWIPDELIDTKLRYKIRDYRVEDNMKMSSYKIILVKAAIQHVGPIVIQFGMPENYRNFKAKDLPHSDWYETGTESHAACCVGFGVFKKAGNEEDYFLYENSLGPQWGDKGLGRIKMSSVDVAIWADGYFAETPFKV